MLAPASDKSQIVSNPCQCLFVCLLFTYLEVNDPDEVGSLRVVFDQTGHPAAFLAPARVPICYEHLGHC